ncbi:DNA-directed RNA polymerase subunit omega [uncultured Desulfovibrio sp.]|uniref:DNA-directed RNA polymerase subunit omega n=1 Tax=uncultured Desulfovibrio sp. TaxID=167968 RepID=UPI0028054041|nr:DNA-directed RNA polymerase subunit omega [uncultured Desulfovibrio sp.]
MARITVEDCQERVDNRFLLVQMAIKRVRQYREGYEPLLESRNKEVVTALREIAAGKILPDDKTLYTPLPTDGEAVAATADDGTTAGN